MDSTLRSLSLRRQVARGAFGGMGDVARRPGEAMVRGEPGERGRWRPSLSRYARMSASKSPYSEPKSSGLCEHPSLEL